MYLKVAFYQKVRFLFQISRSTKKKSKSLSWTWNLKFPPITVNNLFKFQAQDSALDSLFLEIWKTNRTFWKKATFSYYCELTKWRLYIYYLVERAQLRYRILIFGRQCFERRVVFLKKSINNWWLFNKHFKQLDSKKKKYPKI